MTLKELNKQGKELGCIHVGNLTYIAIDEAWVQGYYNKKKTEYYVSSLGRVYNKNKSKFSKLFKNDSGYLYCQSKYKGKRTSLLINRLVLESFKGPSDIKNAEADHIDGNRMNNYLENLQWLSPVENLRKRTLSNQYGSDNSNVKYTKEQIIHIAQLLESGEYTVEKLSKKLSIPVSTIENIKYKRRWKQDLINFDFSKVPYSKSKRVQYTEKQIKMVADFLSENKLNMKEISNKTGVKYDMIFQIKNKKIYKDLLKSYDFSNYSAGKNRFTEAQCQEIDKLLRMGKNPKEICQSLEIEYSIPVRNSIYDRKRKL